MTTEFTQCYTNKCDPDHAFLKRTHINLTHFLLTLEFFIFNTHVPLPTSWLSLPLLLSTHSQHPHQFCFPPPLRPPLLTTTAARPSSTSLFLLPDVFLTSPRVGPADPASSLPLAAVASSRNLGLIF